jgi:FkbM family methyltransferase
MRNSPVQPAIDQIQKMLANSKAGLYVVEKLRNQCELIIGRAHGWGVGPDPRLNGEVRWLQSVIDRLEYVIDIGANKGDWSGLILQQKQLKHLLLFEPSLSALELLRSRFAVHPEIEIIAAAAGNAPGSLTFFEESGAGETSSLVAGFSQGGSAREVEVTTIDAEVEKRGWSFVDFLKIDAEGLDFQVLQGASHLFASGKVSYGQFEYNGPWRVAGATLTHAIQWLGGFGYRCFILRSDALLVPDPARFREYYLYSNYAFIRNDLVENALQRFRSQPNPA